MKTIRTEIRTSEGVGVADIHIRLQLDGQQSDGIASTDGKDLFSLIIDAAGGEIRLFPIRPVQLDKMALGLESLAALIREQERKC